MTPCPHCPDGHGSPNRTPWGVYVAPERDADGQPVYLRVQPSGGAHVADEDAQWMWNLIRSSGATTPVGDDPMPVFVIQGKDRLAPQTIAQYARSCEAAGLTEQAREVRKALLEITEWQHRNHDRVKYPDHKHVPEARS